MNYLIAMDASRTTLMTVNAALAIFGGIMILIPALGFRKARRTREASRILVALLLCTAAVMFLCGGCAFLGGRTQGAGPAIGWALVFLGLAAAESLYAYYLVAGLQAFRKHPFSPIDAAPVPVACLISVVFGILSLFRPSFRVAAGPAAYAQPFFWLSCLGELALLIVAIGLIIRQHKGLDARLKTALLAVPVLLLLAAVLEPASGGLLLRGPALVVGLLLVHTQVHASLEETDRNIETSDLQSRLSLAAGRMRPHYIYNVLTSIYYLCDSDPEQAQDSLNSFSEYLRNALETIENPGLIPFTKELNQIRNYLMLEHMRFDERLHVKYDIDVEDFEIPPLTIQPLVENAVKHGIAGLDRPGTVRIVTRRIADGGVQIRVIDDGVGFDTSQVLDPGVTSNELLDVQKRLSEEIDGEMTITSAPGKGTTAQVTLFPKRKEV